MNKATIDGIFEIISGVFGLVFSTAWTVVAYTRDFFSGEHYGLADLYPVIVALLVLVILFSVGATIAGLFAVKKKRWNFALVGAIFSMIILFFFGIPALVFITKAKAEFDKKDSIA
jgi:hypothetical protein